jgi:3-polyprenyl-4-hydroxybenzoate decarboxylase
MPVEPRRDAVVVGITGASGAMYATRTVAASSNVVSRWS